MKRAWLESLGALNQELTMEMEDVGRPGIARIRTMTANQMLAGEVCKPCNNGWMDALDNSVEYMVMSEASGLRALSSISYSEAMKLSRWIFKTACCLDISDEKNRRRIAPEIIRAMKNPDYLPLGLVTFATRLPEQYWSRVGVSISDRWWLPSSAGGVVSSSRIKFAVHLSNVAFGCVFTGFIRNPEFTFVEGLHHKIILAYGARVGWRSRDAQHHPWVKSVQTLLADTVHLKF